MKKNKAYKLTLLICGGTVLLGIILMISGILMGGTPSFYIDYKNHEVRTLSDVLIEKEIETDDFDSMEVDSYYGDVFIQEGTSYRVSYAASEHFEPTVTVTDGTLSIKQPEQNHFNFDFTIFSFQDFNLGFGNHGFRAKGNEYLLITVPSGTELKNLSASTGSGDLTIHDIHADTITANDAFGAITLDNLSSSKLFVDADTGSVSLKSAIVDELTIENSFGKTTLEDVQGNKLHADSDSGDISGNNVSFEHAEFQCSFGNVSLQSSTFDELLASLNSGDFEFQSLSALDTVIDSAFGDVNGSFDGTESDYMLDLETDFGSIHIDGDGLGNLYQSRTTADKKITITMDSGDIDISFTN